MNNVVLSIITVGLFSPIWLFPAIDRLKSPPPPPAPVVIFQENRTQEQWQELFEDMWAKGYRTKKVEQK